MPEIIYIPKPQDETQFNERLAEVCGRTPQKESKVRAVWGMDATEIAPNGEKVIKYTSFNPLHRGMPYWIIEKWLPPTVFDEQEWQECRFDDGTDVMGDFPRQGMYVMHRIVWTVEKEYAPLCEQVIDEIKLDQFLLNNKQFQLQYFAKMKKRKNEMLEAQKELYRDETKEGFIDYFKKEDYHNRKPDFSFAQKHRQTPAVTNINGEKRTPSGLIIL